jgi:phosphoribosylglycinamide formyltransferase-1
MVEPCPVVVLIGGNGSNLQAIIDNQQQGLPINIAGVISHRPDAYGLVRAERAGIPTHVVDHQQFSDRQHFETALIDAIKSYAPRLIIMAGFMRILSPFFVEQFPSQIMNIHPSLLPKWKGLNTHQRVLEAKEIEHGVSIHFVTSELDGGPIIAQVKIPVLPNDDVETLTERVHHAEHWLYPQVIGWFAQNRLKCVANIVTVDNEPIGSQGMQLFLPTAQGIVS